VAVPDRLSGRAIDPMEPAMRSTHRILLAGFLSLLILPAPARTQTLRDEVYIPDGYVYTTAISGSTLYVGGAFTRLGPPTGSALPIDPVTGVHDPSFPRVEGRVYSAISDGAGGWFIGGQFAQVGGLPRAGLAHVMADNTIADWNPGVTSSSIPYSVSALLLVGTRLLVGGNFASLGGVPRNNVGAVDVNTAVTTPWDPNANGGVTAFATVGGLVYVGGFFTTLGGATHNYLAQVDTVTGIATSWNPGATFGVRSITVSDTTVWVAGEFANLGGQSRRGIGAVSATTGLATAWSAGGNDAVFAMVLDGSTVYACGAFTSIGAQPRNRIAALDRTTALATSWNPNANSTCRALAISGSTAYLGGDFTAIGPASRRNLAAIDLTTGLATPLVTDPNLGVTALAYDGSALMAGGAFTSVGGVSRNRVAAIDLVTGLPTDWNPDVSGTVRSLLAHDGIVYVGGEFLTVGGISRPRLAAVDSVTGVPTAWNPAVGTNGVPVVRALALAPGGTTLFAGGIFDQAGGQTRKSLVELDLATGLATAWDPAPTNLNSPPFVFPAEINALAVDGSTVYAGGDYIGIGGASRNYLAAVDAGTGLATAWNPNPSSRVFDLAVAGPVVYAAGAFGAVGGQPRSRLAAIDASTGVPTAWNPGADNDVRTIAPAGTRIYAGGYFPHAAGLSRPYLVSLDPTTGAADGWTPNPNFWVETISADEAGNLAIGGQFVGIESRARSFLAVYRDETVDVPAPAPVAIAGLKATPNPFRAASSIEFVLPSASEVTLEVFDITGRRVASLADRERMPAGIQRRAFRADRLPSGVYVCRLSTADRVQTVRMVGLE